MSVPRKWLKWGIGTGATLTAALLFQIVKQNDVFLHAVATNQDRALSQTDQLYQRDATNPYRSQHQSLPTETIPETDTVQPFFFTFPQEPATSREKTPQARTHATFVAPDEENHGHQKTKMYDRENKEDLDEKSKRHQHKMDGDKWHKSQHEDDWDEENGGRQNKNDRVI